MFELDAVLKLLGVAIASAVFGGVAAVTKVAPFFRRRSGSSDEREDEGRGKRHDDDGAGAPAWVAEVGRVNQRLDTAVSDFSFRLDGIARDVARVVAITEPMTDRLTNIGSRVHDLAENVNFVRGQLHERERRKEP